MRLDNPWGIAVCLDACAAIAVDRGEHVRAARLYGAEEGTRDRAGVPPWETVRADHEAGVDAVLSALGAQELSRAWSAGRALTQEAAIADALSAS